MKPTILLTAALAASFAMPALACEHLRAHDPYARTSTMMSQSGAAFMVLRNLGDTDDRLIAAHADIAVRVELHTHAEDAEGVMRMIEVEEGFPVPAGGERVLERGGDHVMFLGLTGPMEHGSTFPLTLVWESGCEVVREVPVDLERQADHGSMGDHSHSHGHSHGD